MAESVNPTKEGELKNKRGIFMKSEGDLCSPCISFFQGELGESGNIMNIEFPHNIFSVWTDGMGADRKYTGDIFVGMPLRNQL